MKTFKIFLEEFSRPTVSFIKSTNDIYLRPEMPERIESFNAGVFPRYVDKKELKLLLKQLYKTNKITVENIAQLAVDQKFWLKDTEVLQMSSDDIWKYREYDRHLDLHQKEHLDELVIDIKKRGIKTPLLIKIKHEGKDKVSVYLGEGNHRIAVAQKILNIKTVPVKFYYTK